MPCLPTSISKAIRNNLEKLIHSGRTADLREHEVERHKTRAEFKMQAKEDFITYITKFESLFIGLDEAGIEIPYYPGLLKAVIKMTPNQEDLQFDKQDLITVLGFNLIPCKISYHRCLRPELVLQIDAREIQLYDEGILRDNAMKLCVDVCNSYGTVKYMLTQFPELRNLVPSMYRPDTFWRPNMHYKVTPRSSFSNCDALTLYISNLLIQGGTYES